ncbi:MAG: hypothetical protein AABZ70_17285 [candidate division NC10 bacterium]
MTRGNWHGMFEYYPKYLTFVDRRNGWTLRLLEKHGGSYTVRIDASRVPRAGTDNLEHRRNVAGRASPAR